MVFKFVDNQMHSWASRQISLMLGIQTEAVAVHVILTLCKKF